jgi:hypothetical protein
VQTERSVGCHTSELMNSEVRKASCDLRFLLFAAASVLLSAIYRRETYVSDTVDNFSAEDNLPSLQPLVERLSTSAVAFSSSSD